MGRLRNKKVDIPTASCKKEEKKLPITTYRATRLWNQVVNGFKRFMPLKTHRVRLQVYTKCFKEEDGHAWLVDFINETKLMKPITIENAIVLLQKFVKLNIIEQVCCVKGWLRAPTVLYKFTSVNENRVEKLRALRYYSRTPRKGTPEVDLNEIRRTTPPLLDRCSHTPLFVSNGFRNNATSGAKSGEGKELRRAQTPRTIKRGGACKRGVGEKKEDLGSQQDDDGDVQSATKLKNEDDKLQGLLGKHPSSASSSISDVKQSSPALLCTPCKRRHSMKYDPVFSSTPKDKHPQKTQLDSAYTRALSTIGQSKSVARQFSGKPASKGVKRLGKRGPIAKGLYEARASNPVIRSILDDFDDLIDAIDKENVKT